LCVEEKERHTMTSSTGYPFDWTTTIEEAVFQGQHQFATTIANADELEDHQLQQEATTYEWRYKRAVGLAKQDRQNPGPHFLSAVRNWSRVQAIRHLRTKVTGGNIRDDYELVFEDQLKDEINHQVTIFKLGWATEDKQHTQQALAARHAEQTQAFQDDHQHLIEAYDALETAYAGREKAVQAGYDRAEQFADALEKRLEAHEHYLESTGWLWYAKGKDVRGQQQQDDTFSFVDNFIRVGGKTLGCVFWLVLGTLFLSVGIFAALYFAFPHH